MKSATIMLTIKGLFGAASDAYGLSWAVGLVPTSDAS